MTSQELRDAVRHEIRECDRRRILSDDGRWRERDEYLKTLNQILDIADALTSETMTPLRMELADATAEELQSLTEEALQKMGALDTN